LNGFCRILRHAPSVPCPKEGIILSSCISPARTACTSRRDRPRSGSSLPAQSGRIRYPAPSLLKIPPFHTKCRQYPKLRRLARFGLADAFDPLCSFFHTSPLCICLSSLVLAIVPVLTQVDGHLVVSIPEEGQEAADEGCMIVSHLWSCSSKYWSSRMVRPLFSHSSSMENPLMVYSWMIVVAHLRN